MSLSSSKTSDHPKVTPAGKSERSQENNGYSSLKPSKKNEFSETDALQTFSSGKVNAETLPSVKSESVQSADIKNQAAVRVIEPAAEVGVNDALTFAEQKRLEKKIKNRVRDKDTLNGDNWLQRNGHTVTYFFLYLFSAFVFFRPYEWMPQLNFLQTGAFFLALATVLIYVPAQFTTESNLTILTTEVKSILCLAGLALITIPISKDIGTAWTTFNDIFIKAVTMFIIMVNVLRTRRRLMGIMWLSLGISLYMSYTAMGMYMRGELKAEGYRVQVDVGGMLSNTNDMALHLVTMTPLVVCLGLGTKNPLMRIVYMVMTFLFIAANVVTYSRGAFLGLIVVAGILVWKIGRKQRFNAIAASSVAGIIFILLAPGNYGMRLMSIFIPGLDTAGSSDQRRQLLEQSIWVTLRNPWGIGIGCFPIVGQRNLQTHNAFTQVSSEIGLLGLAAYLIFMISPIKKLAAIERTCIENDDTGWFYYMSIGLQASIAGFMVSSFFGPVAYNWFIYYLVAYAVAFRRVYQIEKESIK